MTAALIPAKSLDQAKRRLSAILSEDERRHLVLAMLEDVVGALKAVPQVDAISVTSPDGDVLEHARRLGAQAVAEPPSARGINQALSHALGVMSPTDSLLVILADVPAVTPGDIESVLEELPEERGVVICPSHDKGTSALALRPTDVIPFRFGSHSFPAHKREAAARGIPARVVRLDSLAYDIDGPDELARFMSTPGETATHRLLERLRVAGRAGA